MLIYIKNIDYIINNIDYIINSSSFLGIFLPRESSSSIISKGDMPAQKYSQGNSKPELLVQ